MAAERLSAIIAHRGLASRRGADGMISAGNVTVNGKRATLGEKADPATDDIRISGKPLPPPVRSITYLLNKPAGYVCSRVRQSQEKLAGDLLPAYPRTYPVGRLDKESEGLILFSNDGELTLRLTHPRYGSQKMYRVTAAFELGREKPAEWLEAQLMKGVRLGDGAATADSVQVRLHGASIDITLTVHEGRHHLVRRMCARLGLDVKRLVRTGIGPLSLHRLSGGHWRELTASELAAL